MDPLQQRKQALLNYILENMTQDDFDRGLDIQGGDGVMGFSSYKKFVTHQTAVINGFNETSIGTMELLRDQIIPRSETMDKEDMGTWGTDGFCFGANNKIVFFHNR